MTGNPNSRPERPWPNEVEAILATGESGDGSIVAESPIGESPGVEPPGTGFAGGADRWSVDSSTVYRFNARVTPADSLARFVEVIGSFNDVAPFAVSPVLGSFDRWLITGRPPGQPGHRPELHADPDDLVGALGDGLRELHNLGIRPQHVPVEYGGQDADLLVAQCRNAVETGAVEQERLPYPYDRYQPSELLAMFIDARPDPAASSDDLVLCHGFAVAERFIVDGPRFAGFDRMESPVVANRHLDLAIMHQSVQHHFGPEAVFRFYQAYGQDPNLVLLDHYILAAHILGRSPALNSADVPVAESNL
ncbi:MAG: phosphotransferase [Acidimicrobiales bacterium]